MATRIPYECGAFPIEISAVDGSLARTEMTTDDENTLGPLLLLYIAVSCTCATHAQPSFIINIGRYCCSIGREGHHGVGRYRYCCGENPSQYRFSSFDSRCFYETITINNCIFLFIRQHNYEA